MKEVSTAIARWLEEKRRSDQTLAATLSVLALSGGAAVFFGMGFLLYMVLATAGNALFASTIVAGLAALALTTGLFLYGMKGRPEDRQLGLDPGGLWILREVFSIGPRLLLEGLRQVRCWEEFREMNVRGCAEALEYLACHDSSVTWQDLVRHCSILSGRRLREQLLLLHGVLFLGEDGARVTLMGPFRLRLRAMLEYTPRPPEPEPEPMPEPEPVTDPELLGAYEILGLSPNASTSEIKAAYRKRVKECHPDLFAGMDARAQALAEKWTRALNEAYATLNPRSGTRLGSDRPR